MTSPCPHDPEDCEYPGCYMISAETVRNKRLCAEHASDFRDMLAAQ